LQTGNIAGSYVWNMSDNGFRNSYGVVTAMFGVTIAGCFVFRVFLVRLNRRLDDGTDTWVVNGNVAEQTVKTGGVDDGDIGERSMKDFRYLV
jgi:hypothetical protein